MNEQERKQKDAEIEQLINVIRATEMERDAGDKVSDNLRAEIAQLRDRIKWLEIGILTKDRVIGELRKAARVSDEDSTRNP